MRIADQDIENEPLEWTYARIAVQCHIRDKVLEVEEWLAERKRQSSWE